VSLFAASPFAPRKDSCAERKPTLPIRPCVGQDSDPDRARIQSDFGSVKSKLRSGTSSGLRARRALAALFSSRALFALPFGCRANTRPLTDL